MANSKLLKEAIADAKAVKETALANAKIALEEAFTPRLQSILSQKMRAEAEVEDKEADKVDEELSSDGIGSKVDAGYAETPGANPTLTAQTDLSVGVKKSGGKPEEAGTDYKKVADISEEENPYGDGNMAADDEKQNEIAELKARLAELEGEDSEEKEEMYHMDSDDENQKDEMDMDSDMGDDSMDMDSDDEESEDDMDLEAIIRELEASINGDESEKEEDSMYEAEDEDEEKEAKNEAEEDDKEKEAKNEAEEDDEKVVDLEEILREMEADMKDDKDKVDEEKEEDEKEMKVELNEAYKVIKSLQKTINEVNLLNAKLLFANKLFRAHNMTNEQKVKVIETLDRTNSVREVKLVYSTLAENFKFSTNKSTKKSISEGIASKVTKSTKPAQSKQVIAENTDFSDRFKKLAGIIK